MVEDSEAHLFYHNIPVCETEASGQPRLFPPWRSSGLRSSRLVFTEFVSPTKSSEENSIRVVKLSRGQRREPGLIHSAPLDRLAQTRETLEESKPGLTEVKPRSLSKSGDSLWRLRLVVSACKVRCDIRERYAASSRYYRG